MLLTYLRRSLLVFTFCFKCTSEGMFWISPFCLKKFKPNVRQFHLFNISPTSNLSLVFGLVAKWTSKIAIGRSKYMSRQIQIIGFLSRDFVGMHFMNANYPDGKIEFAEHIPFYSTLVPLMNFMNSPVIYVHILHILFHTFTSLRSPLVFWSKLQIRLLLNFFFFHAVFVIISPRFFFLLFIASN